MSDIPAPFQPLDLREQIARIDRMIAETAKLQDETRKFVAEARKLDSEARKLDRDRGLAPWLAAAGAIGGLITLLSLLARSAGLIP